MAFTIKKIIDLKGILFLMLLTIPSQAATLDCYGKAFHCVNSTHFMICVDLGGVSTTIDDVIIPCPSPTVCRRTNRFECEFPAPSTLEPEVSTITNIQTTESEAITFTPLVTTAIPFEEYLNTLSTSTLSESELRSSTTESSLTIDPITVGLDSRNVSATESVVTDSIATDAYMNPESLSVSPAISVRPNDTNESNPENNVSLIPSVILNSTTSVNNVQQLTTTEQTKVTDFPVLNTKNSERNSKTSVTSIDITSVVNEQSVTTEENFDKAFQEATMNVTAIDYSRAINNQTVTTEPISTNYFLKPSNNATLTVIANNVTEQPLSTTIKIVKDNLEVSTKDTVTSDTTDAATNQTSITTEPLNGFLQPIINATSTVNISAVTEKVVTTDEVHTEYFQEPSIKTIVTNITKDVNDQILTTKEVIVNNFLQPSVNETTTVITNAVTEEKVKTEQDFWEPSINITSNDITTASKNQTLHTLEVLANDLQSSNNITLNVIPSVVTDQPVTTVTDKLFTTDFQEPSINETRKVTTSAIDDQTVTIEQTDSIKRTSNTSASSVTEQTIKTEETFTKINREPSINITTSDIKSATNNQTFNTVEVLANDLKSSMNLTLTVIPSTVTDQTVTTVADKFLTIDFQDPSTNETRKVTTSAINDQTVGSEPNNFIKTTTSITSPNAVTQPTIKTEEMFINNFPKPSINTIVTSITNATNIQTTATSNSFKNDFLRPSIDPTLMITTSAVTEQISSINNKLVPSEKAAHSANHTIKSEFTTVKSIQRDIKNVSVLENKNKPITETKNNLETTTNTVLTNNNQLNIHASESLIFKTNDSNLMQIISNDIGTTETSAVTVLNNTYNEVSVFTAIPEPVPTDNPLNDGKNIVIASKPESNLRSDTTTSLTDSSVTTESQPNIYSSEIRANDFNDLNVENKPNDTITPEKVKAFIINENNKESFYFNITVAEPEIERLASIPGNITSIKIAPADINSINTETTTGATLNTDIVTPENLIYDILRPIAVLKFDNAPKIATTINKLETLTNLSSTTLPNTTTLISTNRTTANITNNLDSVSITLTDIVLPNSREVKTAAKRYNLNSNNKSETVLNASGLVQTNEFLASILDPSLVEQITTVEISVDDKKVIEENMDSIKKSENMQTNKSAASQPLSIMNQVNDGINAARTDDGKNEKTVTTNIPSTKVNSANGRMSTSKEYTNEAIALNQNKLFFTVFEKTTSNPLTASMDSNQISPSEQIQSHTQTDIFQKDTFTVSPSTKIRDSEGFHSQPELILTEKTDSFPKTTTHSLTTKISVQPVSSDKTKISEGKHLPPSFRDGIIPDDNGQDLISLPTTASVKIGIATTINVNEEKGFLEDKTHNNTEKNIFFIANTEDKQDTYGIEAVVPSQKNEINSRVLEDIGQFTERRFLIESTTVSPIPNTDPIVIAENPSTPFAVTNEGQPEISFSITDRHYDSTITKSRTNAQPSDNFNKNYFLPPYSEAPFTMETVVKKIHSSTLSPVLRSTVPDIYLATTEGIKHSDVSPVFLDILSFPYAKVLTKTENTPLKASTTNSVVNYSAKDTIKQVSATEGNSEKESNVLQNIVPITTPKLEAINQDIIATTVKVAVTAGINTTVAKPGNITTLEENTKSITTNPDLDLQSRLTKGLSEIIPTEINNLQVDLTTQPLVSAAEILRKTTFIVNDERKTTPILALLGKNKTSKILNPEVQSMISNLYLEKKSNTLSTANIMSNQEDIMGTVTTSKIDLLQEPRDTTTKSTPSNSIESATYFMQTTTPISKLDQKQNSLSFSVSSNIASQLMTKTKVNEAPQTIRVTAQASSKSLEHDTQGKYISSNTTPLLDNNTVKRSNGNLSIKSQELEVLNSTVTKQFLGVGVIPPIDFVAYAKKMDTMAPEDFHRFNVGNKVKTQTIEIDDQLILVTESSRSLFDRKQEPQGLKDYEAELDVATVVNTEKYYTVIPSPTIGLPSETWKKDIQTDVYIDKPDKRSINMYSKTMSTTQSLSIRNKSTEQNLKQASSQTTLSISLPDLDFAIEDTTGSDVFVDKKMESEKTHSGIISFLVPPKQRGIKIEKTEKKENETDERPESSIHTEKKLTSFLATYVHTASPDISSKSLTKDINNNVQKDVENEEKILIQTENNNFVSTRLNQVPSSKKINMENNSDYSTHTFSRENKKRTTNNTNGNSTVSRNETHSLNSKSIDQNNASLHAHNMTVISNHQSSTPQNMSEINTTATNNGQTVGYQTLESTTRKPKSNFFSCIHKKRGRYADEQDCKKFYVCIGNSHVVVGTCPVNTVFSEIRKQCTKNLSHCIRNNEFRCVAEGRFSDFLNENVYYICVKNNIKAFVRFKLMCQKGYHLNKTSVRCVLNKESQQSTSKSETSKNNSEQSGSLTKQEEPEENSEKTQKKFKCKKEGIFADPSNCKRYFECTKIDKVVYRQKRKKCDSGEIFHRDKKKCVDSDSYETYEC